MATANKGLQTPANDSFIGNWDGPVNANSQTIDQAFGAVTTLNAAGASGTVALTPAQCVATMIVITGNPAGALNYQVPAGIGGFFIVYNGANIPVGFGSASGGVATIPVNLSALIAVDTSYGARFAQTIPAAAAGVGGNVQFNNGAGGFAGAAGLLYDPGTENVSSGGGLGVTGNLNIGGAIGRLNILGNAATAPVTVAFAPSGVNFDCSLTNVFNIVMSGNMTGAPGFSNVVDGQTINVRFQQDGAGGRTIVWPPYFHWPGGNVAPVLSTPANYHDLLVATYFASIGAFFCTLVKGFA
jgi:hypothetical protein